MRLLYFLMKVLGSTCSHLIQQTSSCRFQLVPGLCSEASASRLGRSKRISARSIHDGPMAVDNLLAEGVQEAEPKQKANKDWQLEPPSSGIPSSSSCELRDG